MNHRSASVLLRMTPEDREELKRLAQAEGRSVQEYALAHLLNRPEIRLRPGISHNRPPKQHEELPMTG